MWNLRTTSLPHDRGLKIAVENQHAAVSYAEALELLHRDAAFRTLVNSALAEAPYEAFRWETPPISETLADRAFEFVVLDSPELDRKPSFSSFAEHFADKPDQSVLSFRNLGGDAELFVPRREAPKTAYTHIAAFVRSAPEEQQHALWQLIGQVVPTRLGPAPLWLSTAGAGVPWLHVRLDARPKYYSHAPYRALG